MPTRETERSVSERIDAAAPAPGVVPMAPLAERLLSLQRTAGNRAVNAMLLQRRSATRSYDTAGSERGPVVHVDLNVQGLPAGADAADGMVEAAMDGVRDAVAAAAGGPLRTRQLHILLRVASDAEPGDVSRQAYALAIHQLVPADRLEQPAPPPVAPPPADAPPAAPPAAPPVATQAVATPDPTQAPRDPAAAAQAAVTAPVMGAPRYSGAAGRVQMVQGDTVPMQGALEYPSVPAPDAEYDYEDWHRVRYMTVWVLTGLGGWRDEGGGDSFRRTLTWSRHRVASTETWLIRKRYLGLSHTTVRTERGLIYMSTVAFQTRTTDQVRSPPPAAEGHGWRPDLATPVQAREAPQPSVGEVCAIGAANTWFGSGMGATMVALGGGSVPGPASVLGGAAANNDIQFGLTGPMIQALVQDSPLMSSLFDSTAMWVRSVPAPH